MDPEFMESVWWVISELWKKDYIYQLSKLVFDSPHKYLFKNSDSQRLFKGFDEIIISE